MHTKEVETFIELFEKSNIQKLKYKTEAFELELDKGQEMFVAPTPISAPKQAIPEIKETANNLEQAILCPLVGVFYDKPEPGKGAFVKEGDQIAKGDVLCIIEAMKVMNEIKSDRAGVIEEVCVNDGDAVAFDQPLFIVK